MKGSPYGAKGSGGYDMKPRTSKNFDMSGMKNSDGSAAKPGAPGFFGKLLDPLGLAKKAKGLFGKKGGGAPCPPAGDPKAAAAAAPVATGAAPVDPDLAAGPVAPATPEEVPAPTQMRKSAGAPMKASPATSHKKNHKEKGDNMLTKGIKTMTKVQKMAMQKANQVAHGIASGAKEATDSGSDYTSRGSMGTKQLGEAYTRARDHQKYKDTGEKTDALKKFEGSRKNKRGQRLILAKKGGDVFRTEGIVSKLARAGVKKAKETASKNTKDKGNTTNKTLSQIKHQIHLGKTKMNKS